MPTDHQKQTRHTPFLLPPALCGVMIEFAIILVIMYIIYCLNYITNPISIGLVILLTLLIMILSYNIFDVLRAVIVCELKRYYRYQVFTMKRDSLENKEYYRSLAECTSYWKARDHINDNCAICKDPLNDHAPKNILWCGHIFHTTCFREYEEINYHQNEKYNKRSGKCPLCRKYYYFEYHKFTFDPNYYDKAQTLYQTTPSFYMPIDEFIGRIFWEFFTP